MIGWQHFRKRELPPLKKRRETTLAATVVWHKGSLRTRAALDAPQDLIRAVVCCFPAESHRSRLHTYFYFQTELS